MRKTLLLLSAIMLLSFELPAQRLENLIPKPQQVKLLSDNMVEPKTTSVKIAESGVLPSEGYTIKIKGSKIDILAEDSTAIVWAKRTLEQLKGDDGRYPEVEIKDSPEFAIRGFMYDAGRNFMEVDMVKRYINLMSRYKLNIFHWHLTDNPAWRIESKIYPQLNDGQYHRATRDPGRYYSYDEIRDVIRYAKECGVTVVPEIDMPGHSAFFNRTFGVHMASEKGMKILEQCLEEFFSEIPIEMAPYFHIGSDEVHIDNPKEFMKWAEALCEKHGRKAMAWNPGLAPSDNTICQVWNPAADTDMELLSKGAAYIDSFMGYLNYYDPIVFTYRNMLHKPCATGESSDRALGGILCLWNDVRVIDNSKLITHNGVISALLPFAERFWCGGSMGHSGDTSILPDPNSETGAKVVEFERRMIFHRDNILRTPNFRWVSCSQIEWNIEIPAASKSIKTWGGAVDMNSIIGSIGFTTGETCEAIATTKIYSPSDTTIYAWVGFEAVARSNRKGNGIGQQGRWETGSQIFANDREVHPAQEWLEPGAYNFQYHTWHKIEEEAAFTDEQFYWVRTPARIPLKKGENTIKMVSKKRFINQRWSFAFVPLTITLDGSVSEVEGVIFR